MSLLALERAGVVSMFRTEYSWVYCWKCWELHVLHLFGTPCLVDVLPPSYNLDYFKRNVNSCLQLYWVIFMFSNFLLVTPYLEWLLESACLGQICITILFFKRPHRLFSEPTLYSSKRDFKHGWTCRFTIYS